MDDGNRSDYNLTWKDLGDIEVGRPNLGPTTSVEVYRLMQFSLKEVLVRRYGREQTDRILYEAGRVAGREFCTAQLNKELNWPEFVAQFQEKLKELNVSVLRMEKSDLERMQFVITIAEDLDCSGLPVSGETVCDYDEGFLEGVLSTYLGRDFEVREVDCWASGGRICRFTARTIERG